MYEKGYTIRGEKHHHYGKMSGANNPSWKGGRIKSARGYILIKQRDHPGANPNGYIREHRLVMEQYLGRYLYPEEVVHHINGILDDNRRENLQLFPSEGEHRKFHNQYRNRSPEGRYL